MFLAGLIACAITGILILVRIILGETTINELSTKTEESTD